MSNVAIPKDTRKRLAYVQKPDEYLRDTVDRLVNEEIARKGIKLPENLIVKAAQ